jgi:hypothetical protein
LDELATLDEADRHVLEAAGEEPEPDDLAQDVVGIPAPVEDSVERFQRAAVASAYLSGRSRSTSESTAETAATARLSRVLGSWRDTLLDWLGGVGEILAFVALPRFTAPLSRSLSITGKPAGRTFGSGSTILAIKASKLTSCGTSTKRDSPRTGASTKAPNFQPRKSQTSLS